MYMPEYVCMMLYEYVCACMSFFVLTNMQKENGLGLDLVRCNLLSKMYLIGTKPLERFWVSITFEHPPAELLVSDLPTVPTAHLILTQIFRYLYLDVQYSNIQTHTDNTNRYIRIHTYTYTYIQIHIHMHSVKTGLGGVFSCGKRPLMTLWPCSDQADQLG